MKSGRLLPIPMWLVVMLFAFGAGTGLGAGYFLSLDKGGKVPLPWDDEKAVRQQSNTENRQQNPQVPQKSSLIPPKTDKRWLNNITNGPVKRALSQTAKTLQLQFDAILLEQQEIKDWPQVFPVHFKFKNVGSVATLLELNALCASKQCKNLNEIFRTKLIEKRYDFPVETGDYQLLYNFTLPEIQAKIPVVEKR